MDVAAMHRLPANVGKVLGIIIRFYNRPVRDHWLEEGRTFQRESKARSGVCLLENMTRQSKALHWTTQEWARGKRYQFTWHCNGKTFVRRKNGDPAMVRAYDNDLLAIE